jgi:hypothetical protein
MEMICFKWLSYLFFALTTEVINAEILFQDCYSAEEIRAVCVMGIAPAR